MPFKAPSVSARDLSAAVAGAIKVVPKDLVAGPKLVIRPEIIGIILRDQLELKQALETATAVTRGVTAAMKGNDAFKGLKISEPGLLVTRGGILAGFFPTEPPMIEF